MNDEKYKILIEQIKEKEPVLTDPQKLTTDIMSSIEVDQRKKTSIRFLEILSWASSVAAVLLLALFIAEKSVSIESPVKSKWGIPNYASSSLFDIKSDCQDNIKCVVKLKLEQQKKRESFYAKLASRY